MNLHGKTALVTGSTSGRIAKELAQAGAQVISMASGDSSHARAEVAALGKILITTPTCATSGRSRR